MCRRSPRDVLAADADRAAADRHQAHDGLAERRLAHAVAADDGEHAGIEREVDALQRMRMAVVDVEAPDLESGGGAAGLIHDRLRDKAPAPRGRTGSPAAALP